MSEINIYNDGYFSFNENVDGFTGKDKGEGD